MTEVGSLRLSKILRISFGESQSLWVSLKSGGEVGAVGWWVENGEEEERGSRVGIWVVIGWNEKEGKFLMEERSEREIMVLDIRE